MAKVSLVLRARLWSSKVQSMWVWAYIGLPNCIELTHNSLRMKFLLTAKLLRGVIEIAFLPQMGCIKESTASSQRLIRWTLVNDQIWANSWSTFSVISADGRFLRPIGLFVWAQAFLNLDSGTRERQKYILLLRHLLWLELGPSYNRPD